MKKFFALVLAVAMVLSMSTAFATIGWAQSSAPAASAKTGVSISVKALEFSGTKQDFEEFGHLSNTVWKEITGRVVKDTIVKFPISVTVPSAKAAGLNDFDYVNEKITVTLTNATAWKIVDAYGNDVSYFDAIPSPGKTKMSTNTSFTVSPAGNLPFQFTVLAIVNSTAEVKCNVSFTMGQKVYDDGTDMYFGNYVMEWKNGQIFSIDNLKTGASINFYLDANNKFTSDIDFYSPYFDIAGYVPVHYCLNGELAFDGCCACNKFQFNSQIMSQAWYEQVKAQFNEIMAALGFSFGYGSFTASYCTEAGLKTLIASVNASNSETIGACTELGVTATTPSVSIPQTGAVSVIGYALVALAGAALAISKKN